jgi:hypothetical protein
VLLVPLVEVERSCTGGSTGGQAAAEKRARRRCGPAVLVEGTKIGSLGKLRWVTVVLLVLWIGDGKQRWGLPTLSRSRGRCSVKCGGRSRRN